ncbi:hypothetical protein GPECTOR_7g1022 [Gonium pectorale]|uniref:Uncharacterized protein n=1 Tax=Gonium pectorale TaxID=33097 RepID=A0A150GTI5_GONPE|nr:hypothetical protein GPECTOR_7g1022 [Gonium pectorale]|eukprot:KXZ53131.1 hypothetical protein GPECTOR_7g1022 [Gonium pectorale]
MPSATVAKHIVAVWYSGGRYPPPALSAILDSPNVKRVPDENVPMTSLTADGLEASHELLISHLGAFGCVPGKAPLSRNNTATAGRSGRVASGRAEGVGAAERESEQAPVAEPLVVEVRTSRPVSEPRPAAEPASDRDPGPDAEMEPAVAGQAETQVEAWGAADGPRDEAPEAAREQDREEAEPAESAEAPPQTDGQAALLAASKAGNLSAVRSLLLQAASPRDLVNARDEEQSGYTPLHLAAFGCHKEVAEALLEAGADPSVQAASGETPLHVVCRNGELELLKLLLRAGSSPNVGNKDGWTALHLAGCDGNVDAISALLQAGASVSAMDQAGLTPLHAASRLGQLEVAQALLAAGADPCAMDESGNTAIDLARKEGHETLVGILERAVQHEQDE